MIDGLCKIGWGWARARIFFKEMLQTNMIYHTLTYNSRIDALCK